MIPVRLIDISIAFRRRVFARLAVELPEVGISRSEVGLSRSVEDLCEIGVEGDSSLLD